VKTKEQLDQAYLAAQNELQSAQSEEATRGWGTLERAEAHSRVRAALDELSRVEDELSHPEKYEEQVQLVAPVGTVEVMPRSQAESIRSEFPDYEIQEA
jgi:hypothetical protein